MPRICIFEYLLSFLTSSAVPHNAVLCPRTNLENRIWGHTRTRGIPANDHYDEDLVVQSLILDTLMVRRGVALDHQHEKENAPKKKVCQDSRRIHPFLFFIGQKFISAGESENLTSSGTVEPDSEDWCGGLGRIISREQGGCRNRHGGGWGVWRKLNTPVTPLRTTLTRRSDFQHQSRGRSLRFCAVSPTSQHSLEFPDLGGCRSFFPRCCVSILHWLRDERSIYLVIPCRL